MDGKEQKRLKKLAEREREKELKELFNVIPSKEDVERAKLEEEKKAAEAAAAEGGEEKEEDIKEEEIFAQLDDIEDELDEEEDMSLEEIIEKERVKIVDPVPVTEESFKRWKLFKLQQQEKENERLRKLEEQTFKKSGGGISGKHLFEMDQTVFVDDADAEDKDVKPEETAEDGDIEQDDSLFLDDDAAADDNNDAAVEEEDTLNYNEETWEDKANPPKNQLMDLLAKKKIKVLPKYESVPVAIGQLAKCILPHLENKEFLPSKVYNTKKAAEHNAALFALRFLQEEDAKAAEAPAE